MIINQFFKNHLIIFLLVETDKAIDTAKSFVSDQHKLVVTRQNKLKKAALEAKQSGKIEVAKDFLSKAKSIDQMVFALFKKLLHL